MPWRRRFAVLLLPALVLGCASTPPRGSVAPLSGPQSSAAPTISPRPSVAALASAPFGLALDSTWWHERVGQPASGSRQQGRVGLAITAAIGQLGRGEAALVAVDTSGGDSRIPTTLTISHGIWTGDVAIAPVAQAAFDDLVAAGVPAAAIDVQFGAFPIGPAAALTYPGRNAAGEAITIRRFVILADAEVVTATFSLAPERLHEVAGDLGDLIRSLRLD